jgi:hypothetical protein
MTYREALTFIRKNFTDGEYTGDNPYLVGTSIDAMIYRLQQSGDLSMFDAARLKCSINAKRF